MILRSGYKPAAFINAIALTINCDARPKTDADVSHDALTNDVEGVIYLAGGYWRALPVWDDGGNMIGVNLINPDRTPAEIRTVEQAIAILRRFEYLAD